MAKKKVIISAHISDIHFGAIEPKRLYKELKIQFLRVLKKMPRIDLITINGDLFHKELSYNSSHIKYLNKFLNELYDISRVNDTKIRIIKGTKSHDHDQLNNIVFPKDLDILVINSVCEEELFKGYKVLYLPEEYIKDPEKYYKEYFSEDKDDYYSAVYGHGMFEETCFDNYNSETRMDTAPVFNSGDMMRICKGYVIFGHIHNAVSFKNVYYTGSFSRWCQGEEKPKGFIISLYDLENDQYKIIPCENKSARKFISRNMTKVIKANPIERVIDSIEGYYSRHNIYKFNIIVKEKTDKEYMTKVTILQRYFSEDKLIDIILKKRDIKDELEEELEQYDYVLDDSLTVEDKVSIFIKDKFDYKISSERIEQLISCDISRLMNDDIDETRGDG